MLGNYLKIALRNMARQKGYSLINITGLAVGMACCVLILLWVRDELSYDRFHRNADRIYRVGVDANFSGRPLRVPLTNIPMAPVLSRDYPEVLAAVRIDPVGRVPIKYGNQQHYEENLVYADNSIFEVFTFPLLRGNPEAALAAPYSAVITKDLARKYFGNEDPVGKVLRVNDETDFTVTGVAETVPHNSHFTFDMLLSFETLYVEERERMEYWINHNLYTYLLLAENVDYLQLEQKFPALINKHLGPTLEAVGGTLNYFLQPLSSIHLHSHMEGEFSGNGDITYVYLFSALAVLVLTIAGINFINLSTARSANRAREVGTRKSLGADQSRLIGQFLGESILFSLLALALMIVLLELALPLFNSLTGREMNLNYWQTPWLIPGLIGMALVVGIFAGIYPALFLSSFRPARVLKGNLRAGAANSRLRALLVVSQFAISIALIVGTFVVRDQLDYLKNKKLGFNKEQVLVIPNVENIEGVTFASIMQELRAVPGVAGVAASSVVPGGLPNVQPFLPEGFAEKNMQLMNQMIVDHNFIPTLGMELVAGRNFSAELSTDSTESVIINETTARRFGWDQPVGKTINRIEDMANEGEPTWKAKTVIGVVGDFHINSLYQKIEPLFIENGVTDLDEISIRVGPQEISRTLGLLRDKWEKIAPQRQFDYYFLDQAFDSQYRSEEQLGGILLSFSLLGVFVGCLGLFGMAAFTAEQRTREIGVRKVHGATVTTIVLILSKEYTKLVALANLIAWPVMYFAMDRWLENFAYRIDLAWTSFPLAGGLALLIALITVSYQSVKAAITNPVDALKYE